MWRIAPVSPVEEKTSPHSWLVHSWLRPSLGGNGMSVSRVGSLFWVVAIRGRRRKRERRSRRRRENILVVWKEYTAVNRYFPTPASNEIHLSIYRSCISGWNMIRPLRKTNVASNGWDTFSTRRKFWHKRYMSSHVWPVSFYPGSIGNNIFFYDVPAWFKPTYEKRRSD